MFRKPNLFSGIPIYVQLKEQIRHLVETSALKPGDQLPSLRVLSETLAINPNTVARVYRELELEGVIEVNHGLGAFIAVMREKKVKSSKIREAQTQVMQLIESFRKKGLTDEEIRRLIDASFSKTSSKLIS